MTSAPHPFVELISRHATAEAAGWFVARHAALTAQSFPAAYAGAGRRLGMQPLTPTVEETHALEAAGAPVAEGWPLSAVGRAALLVKMCELLPSSEHVPFVAHVFKTGDNAEREALLR